MNRLKSTMLIVFAAMIALSSALVPSHEAMAQSAALSIPPKKNYTIEAGKSVSDTLVVRNMDMEEPLSLSLRVVDFTSYGEGGAPKLMLDEDAPQTTWSLKPFVEIPNQVTIEPGTSESISMRVTIPDNQGAGSYYSAIVYSSGGSDGGNVGLSASGVTLAFVGVPGLVDEKLTLEKLGAYHPDGADGGRYSYFNFNMPENIGYTLKNEGNVFESPVGSIVLKPLFGKSIEINNINPAGSLALIGQTREFTPCIVTNSEQINFQGTRADATSCANPGLWPGYYSVDLMAFYGQNGNNTEEIIGQASFWYLPWWFILISMIVIAFIVYHIWKIKRSFDRRRGNSNRRKRPVKRSSK